MASKLVVGSIVLIAVGLVLVVAGNPSLRFVTGTGSSVPTNSTVFNRTGTFNFTRTGSFNFTGGTFPGTQTGLAGRGRLTTPAIESLAGVGLVAAGLFLEVFSVFVRAGPAATPGRAEA